MRLSRENFNEDNQLYYLFFSGYPSKDAVHVALNTVRQWLEVKEHADQVIYIKCYFPICLHDIAHRNYTGNEIWHQWRTRTLSLKMLDFTPLFLSCLTTAPQIANCRQF